MTDDPRAADRWVEAHDATVSGVQTLGLIRQIIADGGRVEIVCVVVEADRDGARRPNAYRLNGYDAARQLVAELALPQEAAVRLGLALGAGAGQN